jgi:hypothetical protein
MKTKIKHRYQTESRAQQEERIDIEIHNRLTKAREPIPEDLEDERAVS